MRRSRKNASERRSPRYYVSQNLIDKRHAHVHAGDCGHCNDGRGPLYGASGNGMGRTITTRRSGSLTALAGETPDRAAIIWLK